MSWTTAIVLGLVTGLLGNKSITYYYSLRFRLKTEAKELSGFGVDTVALIWILSLAYTPSYVLHIAFSKDDINERVLAFLIFVSFMVNGYISFKRSNPKAFKALFGPRNE